MGLLDQGIQNMQGSVNRTQNYEQQQMQAQQQAQQQAMSAARNAQQQGNVNAGINAGRQQGLGSAAVQGLRAIYPNPQQMDGQQYRNMETDINSRGFDKGYPEHLYMEGWKKPYTQDNNDFTQNRPSQLGNGVV